MKSPHRNNKYIDFAIVGFRHEHILSLISAIKTCHRTRIVACCEEDPSTRKALIANNEINIDYDNFDQMLNHINCDVVAVGDYYSKRGSLIIKSLQAGKHVISDKPVCTSIAELKRIQEIALSRHLCVGCMLDLHSSGRMTALRTALLSDQIGKIHTIMITAQHSLDIAKRPKWYFEPHRHGGTINDIGIHAMDLVMWLTGADIAQILFAHTWNAKTAKYPHFKDAAQFIVRLTNNIRVFCDTSYLAPDGLGSSAPQSWRITCHGQKGVIETNAYMSDLNLIAEGNDTSVIMPPENPQPYKYFQDFLAEMSGHIDDNALTTNKVLRASHVALEAQLLADHSHHDQVNNERIRPLESKESGEPKHA